MIRPYFYVHTTVIHHLLFCFVFCCFFLPPFDRFVLVADCEMNIHKGCVKVIEESCIGALHRKDRGNDRISKIVDRFRPERELKRKLTAQGENIFLCYSNYSPDKCFFFISLFYFSLFNFQKNILWLFY